MGASMDEPGFLAIVPTAIWKDRNFVALSGDAQWLFLMMLTQSDRDSKGIIPLRARRWSGHAANMTVERIEAALAELETTDLVHADREAESVALLCYVQPHWKSGGKRPRRRVPRRPAIPHEVSRAVYARDGRRCVECGSRNDLTLDHIQPYSKGGPDTVENLRVMCRPCNSKRGARA